MEQLIADYIREFLFDTTELNVKDLGVFSTDFVPAEYDASMKVIEPPKKLLNFREETTYTTPTFLQFMAEKNNFSVTAAAPYIERFVKTIKDTVESGKDINLRGLGKFEPGLTGGLNFIPDKSVNFLRSTQNIDAIDVPIAKPPIEPTKSTNFVEEKEVKIETPSSFKETYSGVSEDIEDFNKTSVIEKQTVTEVLENNKKILESEHKSTNTQTSQFDSKSFTPKQPDDLLEDDEDGAPANWMWAFPIAILLLLGMMLAQIALSDKPIDQIFPFSMFMSSKADKVAISGDKKDEIKTHTISENDKIVAENTSDKNSNDASNTNASNSSSANNNDASNDNNSNTSTTTTSTDNSNASGGTNTTSSGMNGSSNDTNTNPSNSTTNNSNSNNTSNTNSSSNSSSNYNGGASNSSNLVIENPQNGFYIVTGSYGEYANALNMYKKINSRGYNGSIIKNKKGLFQSVIFVPNGQIEARNMLTGVRNSVQKDAFITHVK